MITIQIEEQVIIDAAQYVDKRVIGKRKSFNGNRKNQVVGICAEFMIADLLGIERPKGDGFDGGWDIQIGNKFIDIKTIGTTSKVKPEHWNNVIGQQIEYKNTHYLFCSLNTYNRLLTICGFITKDDFLKKATYNKEGDIIMRSDGSELKLGAPNYGIQNKDLIQINSIAELKNLIIFE